MNLRRTWTAPTFRELNLSLEVGMYFEDDEFPVDVPPTGPAFSKLEPELSPERAPSRA